MTARAPRWAWWVATGLGSGWLRPAPGTWGTLASLIAWCLFAPLFTLPVPWVAELLFLGTKKPDAPGQQDEQHHDKER